VGDQVSISNENSATNLILLKQSNASAADSPTKKPAHAYGAPQNYNGASSYFQSQASNLRSSLQQKQSTILLTN